jgi:hypothetical protein
MSLSLGTGVQNQLDSGHWAGAYLVLFQLPTVTRGYVAGPRPIEYNSITYQPNRFLTPLGGESTLGFGVPTRTIQFSNVPTDNVSDAIASIESYDYQNAPVIISTLVLDPITGEVQGVGESATYEIASVSFDESAADKKGERLLTLTIELDPPGRAARERTGVKRALEEQQFDNDPDDTGLEYAATNIEWTERWGRV